MLLELELPRVLAPDLSSNCYSRAYLRQTHLNWPPIRQPFICPLTPSDSVQGERCAPAAFLRSMSNLSGPLSRIEPLSSVPVVTIACPLSCRLVDRSEARCKRRQARRRTPSPFSSGLSAHSFTILVKHLGVRPLPPPPGRDREEAARFYSCISLRITTVIHIERPAGPREGQAKRPDLLRFTTGLRSRSQIQRELLPHFLIHAWLNL